MNISIRKGNVWSETAIISIVVPCLNEEAHLPFFMASLMIQQEPFELVIVDGDSWDNSRSIVDRYRESFPITGLIDATRNLGYVRNKGAFCARGDPLIFTNSDAVLPAFLIGDIAHEFEKDPELLALTGRTISWDGGLICSVAYGCFDILRWLFARLGKFSPSGNFLAIRSSVFWAVGGFPHCKLNEDGELGLKLNEYARRKHGKLRFKMGFYIGHWAGRFKKGPLKSLMFYSYVFGNFSPGLKKVLQARQNKSARSFDD
jgi:glycosyltransferase involved in cell wall biosynthesis